MWVKAKYDTIHLEELNLTSEWIIGIEIASDEFVYGEEGSTWAQVDKAAGVKSIPAFN